VTEGGRKNAAAPGGAAAGASDPSHVSDDRWVRAEKLEEAIAEFQDTAAADVPRGIMPSIGLPNVSIRYAADVRVFRSRAIVGGRLVGRHTDQFMNPDTGDIGRVRPEMAHLIPEPQPWDPAGVSGRRKIDWTSGLLLVERSWSLWVDPDTGQLAPAGLRTAVSAVETGWLPVGPVELFWPDVEALLTRAGQVGGRTFTSRTSTRDHSTHKNRMNEKVEEVQRPLATGNDPAFQTAADDWMKEHAASPASGKALNRDKALFDCRMTTGCTHAQAEKAWAAHAMKRGPGRPKATPDGAL
jgi:hypothetical protein